MTTMTPAFIGIDWGTTHRRAALIAADGTLVSERADGEGALACKGRFRASMEALIAGWPGKRPVSSAPSGSRSALTTRKTP